MKKLLLTLFILSLSLTSLYANESAVKQTIIRDIKLSAECKFTEALQYYTKDTVSIDIDQNRKLYYKDMLLMAKAMDGKHPEEFIIMVYNARHMKDPDPNEEKTLREYARTEQFRIAYPKLCGLMLPIMKKAGEIELKSIKFIKVEIKNNLATVVAEYESPDVAKSALNVMVRKTTTAKLRKENGVWKFYERTTKKRK